MKFVVIGSGAIGASVGCMIGSSSKENGKGHIVCFLQRDSKTAKAFRDACYEHGLRSIYLDKDGSTKERVLHLGTEEENKCFFTMDNKVALLNADCLLVATKRTSNEEVARNLVDYAETYSSRQQGRPLPCFMLQNGLNAAEEIKDHFSNYLHSSTKYNDEEKEKIRNNIVFSQVSVSFNSASATSVPSPYLNTPAAISTFVTKSKYQLSFLVFDGLLEPRESTANLVNEIAQSGLNACIDNDIKSIFYGKLILNMANAVNALAGCDLSELMASPSYRNVLRQSILELLEVYKTAKITPRTAQDSENLKLKLLPYFLALPTFLVMIIAGNSYKEGKTSMLQDMENKVATTEVEYINGEAIRLGIKHGIATPVNRVLRELVQVAEKKQEGSPCIKGEELERLCGLKKS